MSETFANKLLGMQLVGWDDEQKTLTVKKGEDVYRLVFDASDQGGCCGYNDFYAELFATEDEIERNPIITSVLNDRVVEDEWGNSETLNITFFGGSKKLLHIKSESGSGSSWCYGAIVTVKCEALGIDDYLTSWLQAGKEGE